MRMRIKGDVSTKGEIARLLMEAGKELRDTCLRLDQGYEPDNFEIFIRQHEEDTIPTIEIVGYREGKLAYSIYEGGEKHD